MAAKNPQKVVDALKASPPISVAHFAIGFSFTYLSLALMATFAPDLAGALAILIMVGATLTQGTAIFSDISKAVS